MLGGLVSLFIAFCAFRAGWIVQTHTGPGVVFLPIVGLLGGIVLIFGCRRNSVVMTTREGQNIKFLSGPLFARKQSIPKCEKIAQVAKQLGIPVTGTFFNAG